MSDQPDLAYIQRRFDTLQKELREGLHTMQLRDDQRESSYQSLIATLTRQMVQVATEVETRLAGFQQRFDTIEEQLDRIGEFVVDINLKLDALKR